MAFFWKFILPFYVLFQNALLQNVFEYDMEKAEELVRLFDTGSQKVKLRGFEWKDCSSSGSIGSIGSLTLSPDPLSFPGPLNVKTDFKLRSEVDAPLKAELEVWKTVLGIDLKLPCVDNFGSCSYDDVCDLLEKIQAQCPDSVRKAGIDCSCPIKQGSYSLPKTSFDVQVALIPTGDYHVRANLTHDGAEAGCLDLHISIG